MRDPGGSWFWEWISAGDGRTCSGVFYGGAVEGNITAMVFDLDSGTSGLLWLGGHLGLQSWDLSTGELRRFGRIEGLPYANITAMSVVQNGTGAGLWVGTAHGALRYMHESERWRYYEGGRYLAGDDVSTVLATSRGVLIGAVSGGMTILETRVWTLAEKARHYQGLISPRHDRYGYVAECGLSIPGNVSSYFKEDTDNDGLWTSMYAASQVFRYAVTNDPAAKAESQKSLRALQFLFEATPRGLLGGFPARSVVKTTDKIHGQGKWHNSTRQKGWVWKGDTSSDEIAGHMFFYSIAARLLHMEKDVEAEFINMVDALVGGIIDNGLTLIDPSTGNHTTWGVWSPEYLNSVRSWSDDRGLRAVEIMAYVRGAHQMTQKEKYSEAHTKLLKDGYDRIMVNAKITAPCDDNHSDDEEAFLPLYTYAMASQALGLEAGAHFNATVNRFCRITRREKASLYLAMCAVMQATSVDPSLRENLQGWPLELVRFDLKNSPRLDLWHAPSLSRFGSSDSTYLIDQRNSARLVWNSDPYTLDDNGGGLAEEAPSAWLLAYWMSRYHQLLGGT